MHPGHYPHVAGDLNSDITQHARRTHTWASTLQRTLRGPAARPPRTGSRHSPSNAAAAAAPRETSSRQRAGASRRTRGSSAPLRQPQAYAASSCRRDGQRTAPKTSQSCACGYLPGKSRRWSS